MQIQQAIQDAFGGGTKISSITGKSIKKDELLATVNEYYYWDK